MRESWADFADLNKREMVDLAGVNEGELGGSCRSK